LVDEPEDARHLRVEANSPTRDLLEVDMRLGTDLGEHGAAGLRASGFAPGQQFLGVGRILDVAAAIPAARMGGDLDGP
jgi:hypothetical protein